MSSRVLVVLLALVHQSLSVTTVTKADHGVKQTIMQTDKETNNATMINLTNMKYTTYNVGTFKEKIKENHVFDEIYTENEDLKVKHKSSSFKHKNVRKHRYKREDDTPDPKCESFEWDAKESTVITHPHPKDMKDSYYFNGSDCVLVINATANQVVQLTFIDVFHIEYHPKCAYDYLEIRDGPSGYAKLLDKLCGDQFPKNYMSKGPSIWIKFHSDDNIEYEGFHIMVQFIDTSTSQTIPESCYQRISGKVGIIDTKNIDPDCLKKSENQALDVLWIIETPKDTKVYLNFTSYGLAKPNECEDNVVEVFGAVTQCHAILAQYCGSVANAVSTSDEKPNEDRANIMHVRLYASQSAKSSSFNATFTAFRTLDTNKNLKCRADEFDCQDNTCIDLGLRCDHYAHCRLKTDEDIDLCKGETHSALQEPHILVILVIFSLILSGMSFVFLFKCIRKLYQDHKIIKLHIQRSCEDRFINERTDRLLDPSLLEKQSEPRASLERENHTNEMFKERRKMSKHQPISIDSDFIQETDLDEEIWRRDVDGIPVSSDEIIIERNGRPKRKDVSRKEESIRSKSSQVTRKSEEPRVKREIRDVSVGAPDTKESGCQTRESLFQAETTPKSDSSNSNTNSRAFSTFGYSGATVAKPSPPPPMNTSEITIELLTQVPQQEPARPLKRMSDRRPMSAETTRSAPDVIIVSKPIR